MASKKASVTALSKQPTLEDTSCLGLGNAPENAISPFSSPLDLTLEDGEFILTLLKPDPGLKSWSSVVSQSVGLANPSGNMGLGKNALPRCNLTFHPPSLINGEITIDPLLIFLIRVVPCGLLVWWVFFTPVCLLKLLN